MSKDQNPSDKACDAYFDNPCAATSGSYYSDRATFYAGFKAGAASRDAEIAELKAELRAISVALNDPRTDLTMTMVEVITELREHVNLLRDAVERIGKYPRVRGDELGYAGCRTVAAEALAATEVMP